MKIITSYINPDIDGIACMYAYSELLNKQNDETYYYIWDKPKQEVSIICDMFNIKLKSLKLDEIKQDSEFIIVDLNNKEQMPEIIKIDKIVEIIDHHDLSKWIPEYLGLNRLQIDKIGATATIISERYRESGFIPSRESAILLFYAIISNSVNLKSSNTKQRDKEACRWLKSVCKDISDKKIEDIFVKKSYIEDSKLREEMECEFPNDFKEFKTTVAQLEIANVENFLLNKKDKLLNIIKQVKYEKNVDYVFINCVDILNGFVVVFGADEETKEFLEKTFGYEFNENGEVKINKIILRKDMIKILKEKYERRL